MLTTDTPRASPLAGPSADPQVRVASFTAGGCLLLGAGAAVGGLTAVGSHAAYGALIGAGLALGVFVAGALAVHLSIKVFPALSLLVALLTYACQVALALLVFAGLSRSNWLENGTVSGPWLGVVLAGCALVWVAVQVHVARTTRVPVYDLPDAGAR